MLKAIVDAVRDRALARGRVRSDCDRAKAWAWALLEHCHELRVLLIRAGTPEHDLPEVPRNPFEEGQK